MSDTKQNSPKIKPEATPEPKAAKTQEVTPVRECKRVHQVEARGPKFEPVFPQVAASETVDIRDRDNLRPTEVAPVAK